jgi:hypothetical protein
MNCVYEQFHEEFKNLLLNEYELNLIDHLSLIGSFGRKEAGLKKIGSKYVCINDIDILLITNFQKFISIDRLEQLIRTILDVKWIDIDVVTKQNRRLSSNSMWIVDSVLNNTKIHGLNLLEFTNPSINLNSLPKSEILILWKTRLWTMWSIEYYERDSKERDYQLAKLLFSIIDTKTFNNSYVSSYKEKCEKGLSISYLNQSWVNWAYDYKINLESSIDVNITQMRRSLVTSFAQDIIQLYGFGKFKPFKLYFLLFVPKYLISKFYYLLKGDSKNSFKDFVLYFSEIKELVHFLRTDEIKIVNAKNIAKKRLLWMEKQ